MNKILFFRRDNKDLNIKFWKNFEKCKTFVLHTATRKCMINYTRYSENLYTKLERRLRTSTGDHRTFSNIHIAN